jgi:predicted nucleic acid-binding protein
VIVVSNSSPLICLSKIDALDLLRQLYGSVTISSEVHEEVAVSGAGRPGSFEISNEAWIQVRKGTRPADLAAAQERFGLGIGELSTLILSKEIGGNCSSLMTFEHANLRSKAVSLSKGLLACWRGALGKAILSIFVERTFC